MEYLQLGRSGPKVSRLCLGCMSFGDPQWRPYVFGLEDARPFFVRALEAGINFFDTAEMYSSGVSEAVTGQLLRELTDLRQVVIATKIGFPTGGPNSACLSREQIVQGCEASLRRLGVDTIDLYYIHRFDPRTPIDETLAALDQLVRQGKVQYLGASAGYAWEFARALYTSDRNGWARFVAMQNHYNLIYREDEREMIAFCRAEGVGLVPFSPLARGVLARAHSAGGAAPTPRATSDPHVRGRYDSPNDADVLDALRKVAATRESSPAEVALAWLLTRTGVVAPIIGVTKLDHLDTAIRALSLTLSQEEIRALEAPYRAHEIRGH